MRRRRYDRLAASVEGLEKVAVEDPPSLRVLLIAENASYRFGGEAVLPLHYFRVMRARGIPVWMIINERNRQELAGKLSADDMAQLLFVPDGRLHRILGWIAHRLPASVGSFTIGQFIEVVDQRRSVRLARQLMQSQGIGIVHQPTPVSPKHVSVLWSSGARGLGVPVVMGPMNGGINYPHAFRRREHPMDRAFVTMGRMAAGLVHWVMPGKLRAQTLMVANERTREALPRRVKGRVEVVVENGVDLAMYRSVQRSAVVEDAERPIRFVFAGRLVGFKGVDLLLKAFARAKTQAPMRLDILGDGPSRAEWERLAASLHVSEAVTFHGWLSPQRCAEQMAGSDVFVLPSLRECGGAVVLEAMAMRLPVIAANWGGPADYVDGSCGILVDADTPPQFTQDLAAAMVRLAKAPELRAAMGDAGFEKIRTEYDWERKVDRVLGVYAEAIARTGASTERGLAST
jgi:glycosyltransferase involved in cell wall biosynthesis